MELPPHLKSWSEKHRKQEEREHVVDHLLEDMQRFLPTALEPMTLSAVRDYMVTRYGQTENHDKLVMRHEAIKILIRDVEKNLADLAMHAQVLSTASRNGAAGEEAVLRQYFSPQNFQRALDRINELQARLVVCDSEFMIARTRIESLEQEVQQYKSIVKRNAEEKERDRRILQKRREELERNNHILKRVEAERDRSSRTADYVIHQAEDLERRLHETEGFYQEAKRSLDLLKGAYFRQGHTPTHQTRPEPAQSNTWLKRSNTEPCMNAQRERESRQYSPVVPESRFREFFGQLTIQDSGKAGNTMKEQALTNNGGASAEKPVEPTPFVPLVHPQPAMHAGFLRDRAQPKSFAHGYGSSKADNGPQIQPGPQSPK